MTDDNGESQMEEVFDGPKGDPQKIKKREGGGKEKHSINPFNNPENAWNFAKEEPTPPEWWFSGLIQKGKINLLWGPHKQFKTSLTMHLLQCIATVNSSLGLNVSGPADIGYFDEEMGKDGFHLKFWQLSKGNKIEKEEESGEIHSWHRMGINLDPGKKENDIDFIIETVEKRGLDIIVFDSLCRILGDLEENSAGDMGKLMNSLMKINEETGVTVILLHHTPKGKLEARGSGNLTASPDHGFATYKPTKDGVVIDDNLYCIHTEWARYGSPIDDIYFMVTDKNKGMNIERIPYSEFKFRQEASDPVWASLYSNMEAGKIYTTQQLADFAETDTQNSTFKNKIKQYVGKKELVRVKKGHYKLKPMGDGL